MNKMLWIIIVGVLVVLVGGFFLFNSSDSGSDSSEGVVVVDSPEDSQVVGETNDGTADETTTDTSTSTSQDTTQPAQETKEFDVIAKQWEFSPNPIVVNEGDNVVLNIQSIDVTHGFVLSAFSVNERLSPGQTTKVEFTADKKGSFSFFCNVASCGVGHSGMNGILIVN